MAFFIQIINIQHISQLFLSIFTCMYITSAMNVELMLKPNLLPISVFGKNIIEKNEILKVSMFTNHSIILTHKQRQILRYFDALCQI